MEESKNETSELVSHVDEYVKTDVLTELKSGIYNLFINFFHHLVVYHGPEQAMKMALSYLEEIIEHFKTSIEENNND
jgi:hypothetical protein